MLRRIKRIFCPRNQAFNDEVEPVQVLQYRRKRETESGTAEQELVSKELFGQKLPKTTPHENWLKNTRNHEESGENACYKTSKRTVASTGQGHPDDIHRDNASNDNYQRTHSIEACEQVANNLPNTIQEEEQSARVPGQVSDRTPSSLCTPSDLHVNWQHVHRQRSDDNALREMCEKLKIKVSNQKDKIKQLVEELRTVQREKEELLTRLSKFTSNQLADNNPNIADLGDINRPTKLAEKFSELYDNEWTETFDLLTNTDGLNEEVAIKELLKTLQTIFDVCKTEASDQMQQAFKSIYGLTRHDENYEPIRRSMKEFKEERKKNYEAFLPEIRKKLEPALSNNAYVTKTANYVIKAAELCWLMSIQDPPMELRFWGQNRKKFDENLFKPYTETGQYTDFVVWPAVLLTDGGSLLSKGVAQGRKTKKKKKSNTDKAKGYFTNVDKTCRNDVVKSVLNESKDNDSFSGDVNIESSGANKIDKYRQIRVQEAEENERTFETKGTNKQTTWNVSITSDGCSAKTSFSMEDRNKQNTVE